MIHTALHFISGYLTAQIDGRTTAGPKAVLSSLPKDPDENSSDRIFITLLNIEEERVLKNGVSYTTDAANPNRLQVRNPEVRLNLWVLFTAQFDKARYENALKFISLIITIFQGKNVFEDTDFSAAEIADGLEKLVVELQSPTFDQNNQIWQTLGSKMVPFVLYKIRMVVLLDKEAPLLRTTEIVQGVDLQFKNK